MLACGLIVCGTVCRQLRETVRRFNAADPDNVAGLEFIRGSDGIERYHRMFFVSGAVVRAARKNLILSQLSADGSFLKACTHFSSKEVSRLWMSCDSCQ